MRLLANLHSVVFFVNSEPLQAYFSLSLSLSTHTAQVPEDDEQFVPDFQSVNCEYSVWCRCKFKLGDNFSGNCNLEQSLLSRKSRISDAATCLEELRIR